MVTQIYHSASIRVAGARIVEAVYDLLTVSWLGLGGHRELLIYTIPTIPPLGISAKVQCLTRQDVYDL